MNHGRHQPRLAARIEELTKRVSTMSSLLGNWKKHGATGTCAGAIGKSVGHGKMG